jgi:hypothetical protein
VVEAEREDDPEVGVARRRASDVPTATWPKTARSQLVAHRGEAGAIPPRRPRAEVDLLVAQAVAGSLGETDLASTPQLAGLSDALRESLARVVEPCAVLLAAAARGDAAPVLEVREAPDEQLALAVARALPSFHFGRSRWPEVVGRLVEARDVRFAC